MRLAALGLLPNDSQMEDILRRDEFKEMRFQLKSAQLVKVDAKKASLEMAF